MAAKRHIAVEPRGGGRWAVQKDGTSRAASLHDRKTDAVQRATQQAKRERTELVVKGENGQIQSRNSYGNDPRRSAG